MAVDDLLSTHCMHSRLWPWTEAMVTPISAPNWAPSEALGPIAKRYCFDHRLAFHERTPHRVLLGSRVREQFHDELFVAGMTPSDCSRCSQPASRGSGRFSLAGGCSGGSTL